MAGISFDGLDEFLLSMEEVEAMPEYVQDKMLNAQADFLIPEIQARGRAYGVGSGNLLKSIKKGKPKRGKKGGRQMIVAPRGKNKTSGTPNGYVGFLNNYGSRHNTAKPFWTDTVSMSEKSLNQVAATVYDEWLKSKNL